jgi:hypothetical protein
VARFWYLLWRKAWPAHPPAPWGDDGGLAQDDRDVVIIRGSEKGQQGPLKLVTAKNVISCAGLHADRVAERAGGSQNPKVVPFRGLYYQMKQEHKDIVRTNVYPVPSGGGIPVGVHFTPTGGPGFHVVMRRAPTRAPHARPHRARPIFPCSE